MQSFSSPVAQNSQPPMIGGENIKSKKFPWNEETPNYPQFPFGCRLGVHKFGTKLYSF